MKRLWQGVAFGGLLLFGVASAEPDPDLKLFNTTVTHLLTTEDVFALSGADIEKRLAPLGPMERTGGYSCGVDLSIPSPVREGGVPFLLSVSIGASSTCERGVTLQMLNLILPGRHDELAAEATEALTHTYGAPQTIAKDDGALIRKWKVGRAGNITVLAGATKPPVVSILAVNLAE